jgi:hypothetical protein
VGHTAKTITEYYNICLEKKGYLQLKREKMLLLLLQLNSAQKLHLSELIEMNNKQRVVLMFPSQERVQLTSLVHSSSSKKS